MVKVRGFSEEETDALTDTLSEMILASLRRVAEQTADQLQPAVTAASSAGLSPTDVSVITELWEAEIDEQLLPFVGQVYTGSAVSVAVGLADGFPDAALPGVPMVPDEFTQAFLVTTKGNFVGIGDDVWEDVREVLVQGVKNGESIEQIAAKMRYVTEFSQTRATEIARTVTHAAAESGSIAQLRFVGYTSDDTTKEWVSAHDARVRPSHTLADGQRVKLDEPFNVGGATLDFPGDPTGPSAEIRQCRCTMFFDIDDAPKVRCNSLVAAAPTQSSYCVTPTPSPAAAVSPQVKNAITSAWPKVTPAYGGAAIHKAIILVRQKLKTQGVDDKNLDDWTILAVMDEAQPSKGAFTFTSKFHAWAQSPAGKKAGVVPQSVAPTHVVAPSAPGSVTLPKLPPVAPKPSPQSLTYTGQTLGSHGARVYVDADGQRWLFKPQQQWQTDLDIATSRIQSAAGATRPGVYDIELGGQKGSIQFMFVSDEAFPHGSFDPLSLSAEDILTLQQEQIFDWLISNFDTHSGQFIRITTTGRLFGTDKGQAFKFFGQDKLDWDYVPVTPLGSDKLTYSAMWKAYVQGKGIDLQDPTAGPLGEYITRLMAIPDDEYRKMLTAYAQAKGKPTPKAFLDAAVARKNNLANDFAAFWARAQKERAKYVPVTPTAPPPIPAATTTITITDISTLSAHQKWAVMEKWLEANNDVKVTPAWGGAKIWKILTAVKASVDKDPTMPNLTELQILRVMDDVGGFKGKPKTYESVLVQWLDSPNGKKVVAPPSLKKVAAPATSTKPGTAGKVTTPNEEAFDTLASGPGKQSSDVFISLNDYQPGDVIGYTTSGPTVYRISRDTGFPDSVKVEKSNGTTWEYVDTVDNMTDLNGFAPLWYVKVAQAQDPWTTGVKPVVSPVALVDEAEDAITNGNTTTPLGIFTALPHHPVGANIAYTQIGATTLRIVKLSDTKIRVDFKSSGGTWVTGSKLDEYGSVQDFANTFGASGWKLPTKPSVGVPTAVSKIPGKMPGDSVTNGELSASRFLWSQGEEVITSPPDNLGGINVLVSDGFGGFDLKYTPGSGTNGFIVKKYSSKKPLPKSITGIPLTKWKLTGSVLTPGAPSAKAKTSVMPGKNAGDVVTFSDIMAYSSPDVTVPMFIAYAYNPITHTEFRILSYFGYRKIQHRIHGNTFWDDLYDETEPDFKFSVESITWYASKKNGGAPDAYNALLPSTTKTPAGAQTPSYFAGKNVGDDVSTQEIANLSPPPKSIFAEGVDNAGVKYRVVTSSTGSKFVERYDTSTKKWEIEEQIFDEIDLYQGNLPNVKWKAASGTTTKASQVAQAVTQPQAKAVLTGTQTHITGKSIGDALSKDDIWDNWPKYVDGQIIAVQNYYGTKMRVFVVDGKLIIQKQTKSGAWAGTDILTSKWGITGSKWIASNDFVSAQHLKNAKKFVAKKTTPISSPTYAGGTGGVKGTGIKVGDDVDTDKLLQTFATIDADNGTVFATGVDVHTGVKYRIIVDPNGEKVIQQYDSASDKWTTSKKFNTGDSFSMPDVSTWKIEPGWGTIRIVPPKKFTGYAPATPPGYTPTSPIPEVAKFIAPPTPVNVKPLIPPTLDLSGFTDTQIANIVASRKILLSSTPDALFAQMEAVLKEWQAKGAPYTKLTLAHIIRWYDQERDKRKGLTTPSHAYETKIVTWWTQTKARGTTTQVYDAPVASRNLPPVMHRLDDPANPDPDKQAYKAITDEEARELQRDMETKYGRLSTASSNGARDYTGAHYREINHAVRDGAVDASPYRSHILATVQGFRPLTRPVRLLRATGWSDFFDGSITSATALQSYVGRVFAWRRMVSTTIKRKRTYSTQQDVIFDIEAPIGTPAIYAPSHGGPSSEYEMILAPHTLFRIISVEVKGNATHVKVRVVGVADPTTGKGTP